MSCQENGQRMSPTVIGKCVIAAKVTEDVENASVFTC